MRRLLRVAIAMPVLIATCVLTVSDAQAYDPTWPKYKAEKYAHDGVHERYMFGGSTFIDNDGWDANEGADCSGYAAKVWAIPHYTSPTTVYHPYSTASFYSGTPYQVFKDKRYGGYMNIWVYRKSSGAPGDHMGLFRVRHSDGSWTTYEARGAKYGIVEYVRKLSTLISWKYKRADRKNWG